VEEVASRSRVVANEVANERASASASAPELAVIVPTLNEADNIDVLVAALTRALKDHAYEIVFVDDWSTDGTPDAIASLAAARPDIRLIRRYGRRGLSSAVIEGALATIAPVIAVIDADMQHDERLLPALLARVQTGEADIAIGSRYVDGGSFGAWDASRVRSSQIATRLARRLLRSPVADPMSGFFVVRRSALLAALPHLSNMGFKILLDLLASSPTPLRAIELPFEFRTRHAGQSKLDSGVAIEFLLMLLDKSVGRWLPPRLVLFGAVGVLGLAVHLAILRTAMLLGARFTVAQTIAVLTAIAFNFTLNNALTYRDRRLRGRAFLPGLLSFYAVCGLGALANIGAGQFVFAREHRWWLAGIAGAAVGSLWNFAASSVTTWRKR